MVKTALKVLFADAADLYRYSLILVAKECRADIESFEAGALSEALDILRKEDIKVVFVNLNLLENVDSNIFLSIAPAKLVLVKDNHSKQIPHESFLPYAQAVLDFEKTLEANRAQLALILND